MLSSESLSYDVSHIGKNLGVLGDSIEVYGDWLPRHILGKCTAFCAILRMLYLTVIIVVRHLIRCMTSRLQKFRGKPLVDVEESDVILMDGVSASLPLLFLAGIPSIFYCHFPDKVRVKLK
jgi:alpha-1,3/alpha-1,6-mannosyltransferase